MLCVSHSALLLLLAQAASSSAVPAACLPPPHCLSAPPHRHTHLLFPQLFSHPLTPTAPFLSSLLLSSLFMFYFPFFFSLLLHCLFHPSSSLPLIHTFALSLFTLTPLFSLLSPLFSHSLSHRITYVQSTPGVPSPLPLGSTTTGSSSPQQAQPTPGSAYVPLPLATLGFTAIDPPGQNLVQPLITGQ